MNHSFSFFKIIVLLYFILSAGCAPVISKHVETPQVPVYNIGKILKELPDGERWIQHLEKELLPFWTMETALGEPVGRFPTYRNNDGTLLPPIREDGTIEAEKLSPEFKALAEDKELAAALFHPNREYIRSQSRQIFSYGLSYHMTGKTQYLNYAKAGVEFLRKEAIDRIHGGAFTYYITNEKQWGPDSFQRTSQDMAYALTGLGFYYYLTHNQDVLKDILFIKNHIFNTYFDQEKGLFTYVLVESPDGEKPNQKELVAQLDQLYAYMLWLAPSLPEPHQTRWKQELHQIAGIIIEQFFSEKYQFFWGTITNSKTKFPGAPHTDFGHSIKTMWLIYQIGKMTDDIAYINFAKEKAVNLIQLAYDKTTNSWGQKFDENGKFVNDKEWWSLAELDQTTATLSLTDPSYAKVLTHTYKYWFKYMIDHEHGGVWHMVDGATNKPVLKFPKQHSWKTSLHTFEHALIGYMTTQQLKNKPITLYYAFEDDVDVKFIHPYFYKAKIQQIIHAQNTRKYQVIFTDLR